MHLRRLTVATAILTGLAACQSTVQTSSGADYLARMTIADPAIRAAAQVEATLRLPARIGVARLDGGALSIAPGHEAHIWEDFTPSHAGMGEWVPIDPVMGPVSIAGENTMAIIRREAARRHLDYVLVYEIGARSGPVGNTPLAIADITIVGGLPLTTRTTQATGTGTAAFVDVRSGYVYGTAAASEGLAGLARSYDGPGADAALRGRASFEVAQALLPRVDDMLDGISRRAGPAR
jgi:hypothetical protein